MKVFHCLLMLTSLFVSNDALEGSNICYKPKARMVEVPEETTEVVIKETFSWCVTKFPPRCRKKKKIYIPKIKMVQKLHFENVTACCDGYTQIQEKCIPICLNACVHGQCIGPEECECIPGWAGSTCNLTCEPDKWGPNCNNTCNCPNGTRCDPVKGSCICLPGYTGKDCVHQCDCFNGGICKENNGVCDCPAGFSGTHCEARCPTGTFGKYCSHACDCLNAAGCNIMTGECNCLHGYSGNRCQFSNCSIVACEEYVGRNDLLQLADNSRSNITPIAIISTLLLIIVLAISAFLILRHKKKIHELKNELAYVSYSVDKPTDRYDNPVYAYPNMINPSSSMLNPAPPINLSILPNPGLTPSVIGMRLNNDLSMCKNNVEKAKLGEAYCVDDCRGAAGGIGNGDSTLCKIANNSENLNIYHNIDEKKYLVNKEPIYDEIPFNKTAAADDDDKDDNGGDYDGKDNELDHLHYDKPKVTIRNNYDYPKDKH